MKNNISILLVAFLCGAFASGCNKQSDTLDKSKITLSKSSVNIGEPLMAATDATGNNFFTRWTVSPSENAWISPSGNKSVILFSGAGNYRIMATYFRDSLALTPYDSSFSPVVVTNSIYNDTMEHCLAIVLVPINTNDQITLTPVSYSDAGLVLLAHTQQLYGAYHPRLSNPSLTDSTGEGYNFSFGKITEYPCEIATVAPSPAIGIVYLKGLSNGIHNVAFSLNGNNYTGSLTVTDADCTFSWNYTTGINVSPLHITK